MLLTGDMQFAEPGIDELDPYMSDLRAAIAAEAPFSLVKIGHHASHNAFDEDVLTEMGATKRYAISGGIEDRGHPDAGVLKLLKKARADSDIEWARTDKNGLITVTFGASGGFEISRGRMNSSRPNEFDVAAEIPVVSPAIAASGAALSQGATQGSQSEQAEQRASGNVPDVVRLITEVPHTSTQVTVTINVQPGERQRVIDGPGGGSTWQLASGRQLPKLLFVTCRAALEKNIGQQEAANALQAIRTAGQPLVDDLPEGATEPQQVLGAVQRALQAHRDVRGVVIVGGYDVVPASRLDAIDPVLRRAIEQADMADGQVRDIDQFVVWSDAIFGDVDGDGMSELPVSRIPDGHSSELVRQALSASGGAPTRRAGVRNLARPFADTVFDKIHFPQHKKLLVSQPTQPASTEWTNGHLQDAAIYIMLHGNYINPTNFAGENPSRQAFTAIHVDNVKGAKLSSSVVFAGCCWGALTVRERAIDVGIGGKVTALVPEGSMALSFLQAGALAFVGCTGVHYSPMGSAPSYNGGPMHVAFWKHYAAGQPPAEALFSAKKDYLAGIPHDPSGDAFDRAIELKILRQFTCLGLGW